MIISRLENWLITITRVTLLTLNSSDLEYEKKITQYFFLFILYIQHFLGYSGLKVLDVNKKVLVVLYDFVHNLNQVNWMLAIRLRS